MKFITAIKNGVPKTFAQAAWDRLPASKNGWKQMPDEAVKIEAKKPTPPSTPAQAEALKAKEAAKAKAEAAAAPKATPKKVEAVKGSSEDFTTVEVIAKLKGMTDPIEMSKFVAGDKRKTVVKAAGKRILELKK